MGAILVAVLLSYGSISVSTQELSSMEACEKVKTSLEDTRERIAVGLPAGGKYKFYVECVDVS